MSNNAELQGMFKEEVDQIKRDRDFLRDDNMKIQLDVQLNGSVDLIMPVNIPRLLTNIK